MVDGVDSKVCLGCQVLKPLNDYTPTPLGRLGRVPRCRACDRMNQRARRAARRASPEPEEAIGRRLHDIANGVVKECGGCGRVKLVADFPAASNRKRGTYHKCRACQEEFYKSLPGRYNCMRSTCRARGWEVHLSLAEYIAIVDGKGCTYCGMPLVGVEGRGSKGFGSGLDRIDSSLPYTASNVTPCCAQCNMAKAEFFTYEEMLTEIGPAIRRVKQRRMAVQGRLF